MKKEELLAKLTALREELASRQSLTRDEEDIHPEADEALVEYIGDEEIAAAYRAIPKWYA